MSKEINRNDMTARCELALMGKVVPVNSNDEVPHMTQYILDAMGSNNEDLSKEVLERITKYHNNKVKYLVCNTVYDMRCITYLLDSNVERDNDSYYPAPFEEDYGTGTPCAFCYTLNVDCDYMCSEFGDCFFRTKADGYYHRVS